MAPQEQTEIVQQLEHSREEVLDAVSGLTDEQAKAKPDPARWSVLECLEHVVVVEQRFLGFLEAAERLDGPRVDKEKEARLRTAIPDRSQRAQSPEAALPKDRFGALAEAVEQFKAARSRSLEFAQQRAADLYRLTAKHQRFGDLNGAEFLTLIAGHARRHADQIREARAALGK